MNASRAWLLGLILSCSSMAFAEIALPTMPDNTARIRLFGQNQRPTIAHVGIDCNNNAKGTKINIGGGLGDAFSSFVGVAKNTSLGLAETPASHSIKNRNGILSKAFYKELVVPAGLPLNAYAAYIDLGVSYSNTVVSAQSSSSVTYTTYTYSRAPNSSTSKVISFVPEAGHDYEVLSLGSPRNEYIVVTDITTPAFTSIATSDAFSCKK